MSESINPFTLPAAAAQTLPSAPVPVPAADASPLSPQTPGDSNTLAPSNDPPTLQNLTKSDTQIAFDSPSLTSPSPLNPRQHTAISLLIAGHSISSIAATLDLSRQTLYLWKRNPAFIREFTKRQHEVCRASEIRLRRLLLQTTQIALDSLGRKCDNRFQHAFRLLTILRPYIPLMNQPEPSFPTDAEIDAMMEPTIPKED